MKKIALIVFAAVAMAWSGCDTLQQVGTAVLETATDKPLSESEIVSGLKEALKIGTDNASGMLNKTDGYFKDPLVKIPFPDEAIRAADKLRQLGMGNLVDNFVETLNRGAEQAAKFAGGIFFNAIKEMTISDAKNILFGADNAATSYFKGKTTQQLYGKFSPVIKSKLESVSATKYWGDITSAYNKIPFVNKVNTDLTDYATNKALDGLFVKLEGEEKKIRKDPMARVNDILKRVFGELDKPK